MSIRNIKLVIHYDGTNYHGWASQPETATVQGTIEEVIQKLTGQPVKVYGSSRTDAGVHALGQVANFRINSPVPTDNFSKALNNLLPQDITIADVCEMPNDFDAISDTVEKRYDYLINTTPIRPVLARNQWHRAGMLDIGKMHQAAQKFVGKKDFKSFASAADQRESSVRTITLCQVEQEGDVIKISVAADGFLYNMVRNIVGTLVEVGRGRWEPDMIDTILEAKDRNAGGPIAPASGLCLMEIFY
ncbi:MAG: tRNA pseudouridine(38-40) synthase TruA [Planctomycetota bacterium]|jgi:tRNA pseudouridine38-40 synthase